MKIQPVTHQDLCQAARVLSRAFVDDPVAITVYRGFSADKRCHALEVDFAAELRLCLRRGLLIQAGEDGQMAAVAVIYPPDSLPFTLLDQWVLMVRSILGNGWYDLRPWIKWLKETDRQHPKSAHYYLEYLGVSPQEQGKGYGGCILKYLTLQADQHGVGCYLENANPRNIPFYQKSGFQIIAEREIIGLPTWFMWRPALAGDR